MTNILDDYSNNFNDTQICNMSVLEYLNYAKLIAWHMLQPQRE